MSFFGIDFGTTNSTAVNYVPGAAHAQRYGDDAGRPYPSIVAIDRATGRALSGRYVWEHHEELSQSGRYHIVHSIKRVLGRSQQVWPTQERPWTPEDVAAEILKQLAERAQKLGATRISRAAVTIPVDFPASARKALRAAATKAGIKITTFIKEPTAALIRHLPKVKHFHYVGVFDWGGGTLDISILEMSNNRVFERATMGMNSAGDDIDLDLARAVHARVMEQRGDSKKFEEMSPQDQDQLRTRCEIAKCWMSSRPSVPILMQSYGGQELEVPVDRPWFESIIRRRVDDAMELLAQTVSAVPLSCDELDRLIIIGGSSKLRLLHERLQTDPRFQAKFQLAEDAEWDVAHGAAIVDSLPGAYETAESIGIVLSDGTFYTIVRPHETAYESPREAALALVEDARQANIILARADLGSVNGDASNVQRILELGVATAGFDAETIRVRYNITSDLVFSVEAQSHALGNESKVAEEYGNLRFAYAFPQDVVKLLVRQPNWTGKMRLERDGEFGISEYAPGSEIIADGHVFRSGGIDRQHRELEIRKYRVCSNCRRVERESINGQFPPACACGAVPQGVFKSRNFLEPPGFTTIWDEPVPEPRLFRLKPPPTSEVFLVEGVAIEAFEQSNVMPGVTLGYRSDGLLFRANPGRAYGQFRICQQCGRGFELAEKAKSHRTPWGGRCPGTPLVRVDLAFQFRTDTLQIRFDGLRPEAPAITDNAFWLSLQTAFVSSAAEVLGIPARDIDGTFRSQFEHGRGGELVVFDRVPGGAGYVDRIRHELLNILRTAYNRTRNCRNQTCDPRGSCYACLRSYGNQFQWDLLNRGLVADWLEAILGLGSVPRASA